MTIEVLFTKPKGKIMPIFSWLIRLFEGTKYSHVCARWRTKVGPFITYQASGAQVNFMGEIAFQNHVEIISKYEIEITDEEYSKLLIFALTNAGAPYSLMQVFGIPIAKLFRLKKNPWANLSSGYVCSELIASFLSEINQLRSDQDKELITPKELEALVASRKRAA